MKKKVIKKHVRIGDKVKIIKGSQKGNIGTITQIQTQKKKISLDSIPMRIKQLKRNENEEIKKINLPTYIHWSNVMLWDSKKNCASRIGYKEVDGKKQRYFKKSGNLV